MFRFEGTVRHCLLWRARSHRHDDLRDTTAETYWARALFPPLLLDHAERVSSIKHESRHLPQPRTPVIMGPGLRRDDASCGAFAPNEFLGFNFQTAYFRYHFASRVPDAVQRSSRCSAEPGPKTVQDGPRISSAPRREVRRAAQHPGHASPTLLQL